jgi:SpoVK/Ycf46/Vps4 family AAA+-type ATPase
MLHARGKFDEQSAVREMKNEFMLHWDGLRTRDGEQIVVLAATNRPFDLDEAVLRRMPRRILVSLPNLPSRVQILQLILQDEVLDESFSIEQLAAKTDGYSGSDLKALCIRAAHEPIRELLRCETQGVDAHAPSAEPADDGDGRFGAASTSSLRPVRMSDFFRQDNSTELVISSSVSKTSHAVEQLEVWNAQYGETKGETPKQLSYYT